MTITFTARCNGKGCRHSTKATRGVGGAFELPFGWARTAGGELHACCGTCRKDINARRERMGEPRLVWLSYLGKAYDAPAAEARS